MVCEGGKGGRVSCEGGRGMVIEKVLKGVLAKNERGYRRNAKNKRFRSLLILLLSVASIRKICLKRLIYRRT